MKVKNMINTGHLKTSKSWLDFFKDHIDNLEDSFSCSAGETCHSLLNQLVGSPDFAEHGAHVVESGKETDYNKLKNGDIYYITCFCSTCNNPDNTKEFEVPDNLLVKMKKGEEEN